MLPIAGVPCAFVLEELLSPDQCESIILAAEAIGLKPKVSKRRGPPIRNNSRALFGPDESLTGALEARLAPILARVDVSAIGDMWHLPSDGRFVNSKWRINSYATGEAFLPHYDSGHDFGRGKRTLLSLIIYLNDDFTGGETTFFPADPTEEPLRIKPKTGSALLFHHYGPHSPLHGTAPLIATGRKKYIARTDVIYKDGGHTLERLLFQSPPPVQKAVVLFGVPGAGKSTQLELAAKRHGHAAVNFGRSVRALRGGSSELAQELCAYRAAKAAAPPAGPEAANWLPEDLSRRIFQQSLPAVPAELVILDGYPRMRSQSTQLETSRWLVLSAVYLKVSEPVQMARLSGRDNSDRPPQELLFRMRDWERDTFPLLEQYRKRGLLDEIDAAGDAEATAQSIDRVIAARLFDLVFSFVPAEQRARLADYAPVKRNLSKKHQVYRFTKRGADRESPLAAAAADDAADTADERYLKVVWERQTPLPSRAEGPLLDALRQGGFPLAIPVILSCFSMGPAVNGIISERVAGITLKEAFGQRLAPEPLLAAQWARALAKIHAFVPPQREVLRTLSPPELIAAARQRLVSGAVSAYSFSAKYGVARALELEPELADIERQFLTSTFDAVRPNHGDPCAPNFIWSTRTKDITGCVDLSGAAYLDIHWDLAIACWSLGHNTRPLGQGAADPEGRSDRTTEFIAEYRRCMREVHGLAVDVKAEKLELMYRLARFLL